MIKMKLRYKNPFVMGNLHDLMIAREDNDVEYLKEWSREAVKEHGKARDIQMKAFERLIQVSKESAKSVEEITQMLREVQGSEKGEDDE